VTPFDFPKKRLAAFLANSARCGGLAFRPVDDGNQTDGPPNTGTTRKAGWSTQTGVTTMNTVKFHVLAAVTALALSAGAAMAQEGGSTYPVAPIAQPAGAGLVQSGSSDVTPMHPDALHSIPYWRDLPNYTDRG
jgi:hypothetical protein